MPRSLNDIIGSLTLGATSSRKAKWEECDPAVVERLIKATQQRTAAEEELLASVCAARSLGISWAAIGSLIGTTGEAARQRYDSFTKSAKHS